MSSWSRWLCDTDFIILALKAVILVTALYLMYAESAVVVRDDVINHRPIIGILSQEQSKYFHTKYPENYTSYIAASYVKSVEASGARVVPIMIGRDRDYYRELMSKINGVLFPGGATYFNQSDGFADAGEHIYHIAMGLNDAGSYFPVFGTCLGFELLIILASGRGKVENREKCYSFKNCRLNFTKDFRRSKMYRDAPEYVVDILSSDDVTANAHQFCILDSNMEKYNLKNDWLITSHSKDEDGLAFVASVEHKRYPFYGVQFHPEKVAFEWKASKHYPHSLKAVQANRYFMDFFVEECRRSGHRFPSHSEENRHLIYNYKPEFTGLLGSSYEQCYFFEPRGTV
ncbi:gamma-glutamyl hydrolase A-like isoform X2 [Aricia agestis]|uniref:gamma-glutamyl hydrolase A-like isoform X2 n=1 Tax=Aricia agestis TaxID=91739 RepID=UPI001C202A44|nr:gamma-glutamyl hydrolase A-like isoform X2 [Aricia agestis]